MKKFLTIAAAAASVLCSSTAYSATYVITYKGLVDYEDRTGEIGPAGQTVNRASFTSVYFLELPSAGTVSTSSPANTIISQGSAGSGFLTAIITINGVQLPSFGSTFASVSQTFGNQVFVDQVSHNIGGLTAVGDHVIYNSVSNQLTAYGMVASSNPTDPLHYEFDVSAQLTDGFYINSGFFFFDRNSSTGDYYRYITGNFTNFSVSISAVPETATWGMMIVGFGMMGAAMRTRRRSAKVSFA